MYFFIGAQCVTPSPVLKRTVMEMETLSGMMTLTKMKRLKILALTLMLKKRDTTHSGNTAVQKKPEAVQAQVSTGLCL